MIKAHFLDIATRGPCRSSLDAVHSHSYCTLPKEWITDYTTLIYVFPLLPSTCRLFSLCVKFCDKMNRIILSWETVHRICLKPIQTYIVLKGVQMQNVFNSLIVYSIRYNSELRYNGIISDLYSSLDLPAWDPTDPAEMAVFSSCEYIFSLRKLHPITLMVISPRFSGIFLIFYTVKVLLLFSNTSFRRMCMKHLSKWAQSFTE